MAELTHQFDLTGYRCPQSLLELKRALSRAKGQYICVRLESQSVSDAERWLDMQGCDCHRRTLTGGCVELSFYWDCRRA